MVLDPHLIPPPLNQYFKETRKLTNSLAFMYIWPIRNVYVILWFQSIPFSSGAWNCYWRWTHFFYNIKDWFFAWCKSKQVSNWFTYGLWRPVDLVYATIIMDHWIYWWWLSCLKFSVREHGTFILMFAYFIHDIYWAWTKSGRFTNHEKYFFLKI